MSLCLTLPECAGTEFALVAAPDPHDHCVLFAIETKFGAHSRSGGTHADAFGALLQRAGAEAEAAGRLCLTVVGACPARRYTVWAARGAADHYVLARGWAAWPAADALAFDGAPALARFLEAQQTLVAPLLEPPPGRC